MPVISCLKGSQARLWGMAGKANFNGRGRTTGGDPIYRSGHRAVDLGAHGLQLKLWLGIVRMSTAPFAWPETYQSSIARSRDRAGSVLSGKSASPPASDHITTWLPSQASSGLPAIGIPQTLEPSYRRAFGPFHHAPNL